MKSISCFIELLFKVSKHIAAESAYSRRPQIMNICFYEIQFKYNYIRHTLKTAQQIISQHPTAHLLVMLVNRQIRGESWTSNIRYVYSTFKQLNKQQSNPTILRYSIMLRQCIAKENKSLLNEQLINHFISYSQYISCFTIYLCTYILNLLWSHTYLSHKLLIITCSLRLLWCYVTKHIYRN